MTQHLPLKPPTLSAANGNEIHYTLASAFTHHPFSGNPASVVILPPPNASDGEKTFALTDRTMGLLAREFNLSETAFAVPQNEKGLYALKWFTPSMMEVPLCGHATLATAGVLFNLAHHARTELSLVKFETISGTLIARKGGSDEVEMDFPLGEVETLEEQERKRIRPVLESIIGNAGIQEVMKSKGKGLEDWLVVRLKCDEEGLKGLMVDLGLVEKLKPYSLLLTTSSPTHDLASRAFAPLHGIPEDPVCGSAHCILAPYWSSKLGGAKELRANVVSARGGEVNLRISAERNICELRGGVRIMGTGVIRW